MKTLDSHQNGRASKGAFTGLVLMGWATGLAVGLSFTSYIAHAKETPSEPSAGKAQVRVQEKLTLTQVLNSVDAHFPLVIGAMQDREKAKGDLLAARGGFDPVLRSSYQTTPSGEYVNRAFDFSVEQPTALWGARFFAGYRNGQGKFGPYDEKLLTTQQGEVRGGLEIPLLRGGPIDERRARIGSNEQALENATQSLDAQKLDSKRLASYRYYEWISAGEKLKIADELLKLALDRDDAMKHRVLRGDAAKVEQVDNLRSVNQREAGRIAAKRSFDKASLDLSLFYRGAQGAPLLANFEQLPTKGFEVPSAPEAAQKEDLIGQKEKEWVSQNIPKHPETLRLQAQIGQNEVDQSLAKNSIFPKLDAEFAVAQDLGTSSSSKTILEYKAALKLEFPLLLRTGRGRSEATLAQGLKLDAQLNLTRNRLEIAIQDASQAIRAALRRITLTQSEVTLAAKVEEAERVRFKQGDSNILTVNLREQTTADARSRSIDALADFYRAKADLEAATGSANAL
jgi:cobalt-zinc-cadmium efflux system outer membrane protein